MKSKKGIPVFGNKTQKIKRQIKKLEIVDKMMIEPFFPPVILSK